MDELIVLDKVTKEYNKKTILQDVCLDINKGDSIALTGHNGCGKSTLIKIISGFVNYDKGNVEYKKDICFSYVPEHFPKIAVSPKEYIKMTGTIEGIDYKDLEEKSIGLFRDFFMESMINIPIKNLSKGTIQKVAVIQAFLSKPDVLLLDEPLSGQDSESQQVFINKVREINKNGTAVIMSCHEPWLVEAISKQEYKIENRQLILYKEIHKEIQEFVVLRFAQNKEKNINTNKLSLEQAIIKTEEVNDEKILYVNKENSDFVITEMIKAGHGLRGIKNERIY